MEDKWWHIHKKANYIVKKKEGAVKWEKSLPLPLMTFIQFNLYLTPPRSIWRAPGKKTFSGLKNWVHIHQFWALSYRNVALIHEDWDL